MNSGQSKSEGWMEEVELQRNPLKQDQIQGRIKSAREDCEALIEQGEEIRRSPSCQIPAGHLIHKGHQYGCVRTSEQIQRKTSSSNSLRTYKPILRLTQLPFLLGEEKWVNIQKN